jgi:uncharacterized membrane protein
MVRHDGRLYLIYSANAYAQDVYAVGYAVCDAPLGPCRKAAENPILKSSPAAAGPGHSFLVTTAGGQTWLLYHAWPRDAIGSVTPGRQLWLDRVDWVDGKPVVRGPTEDAQNVPARPHPGAESATANLIAGPGARGRRPAPDLIREAARRAGSRPGLRSLARSRRGTRRHTFSGGIVESRVRALGHPVHPMLIVFPLGLFVTATVFDLIQLISGDQVFGQVGFWNISAGIIGAVLAALTGLADWSGIPRATRAKRIGLLHGGANTVVLLLFALAWLLRVDNREHNVSGAVFVIEVVAAVLGGIAAWLGGELVDRLGIGVHDGAHPDASSSLGGQRS